MDSLFKLLNRDAPDDEANEQSGISKFKKIYDHVIEAAAKIDKVLPGFDDCCYKFDDGDIDDQIINRVYPEVKVKCGGKFDGRDPVDGGRTEESYVGRRTYEPERWSTLSRSLCRNRHG
jgi:hypothetical protein